MSLDVELETFRRVLPELLAVPGNRDRFVVIRGDVVAGVYDSRDAAEEAGYDRFGLVQFLIREITDTPRVYAYSHAIVPCR